MARVCVEAGIDRTLAIDHARKGFVEADHARLAHLA